MKCLAPKASSAGKEGPSKSLAWSSNRRTRDTRTSHSDSIPSLSIIICHLVTFFPYLTKEWKLLENFVWPLAGVPDEFRRSQIRGTKELLFTIYTVSLFNKIKMNDLCSTLRKMFHLFEKKEYIRLNSNFWTECEKEKISINLRDMTQTALNDSSIVFIEMIHSSGEITKNVLFFSWFGKLHSVDCIK